MQVKMTKGVPMTFDLAIFAMGIFVPLIIWCLDGNPYGLGRMIISAGFIGAAFTLSTIQQLPEVVYTHAPCPDGVAACLLLRRRFAIRNENLRKYTHGKTVIDLQFSKGKVCWAVDICPPASVLIAWSKVAKHIHIVDHHKTAFDTVAELVKLGKTLKNVTWNLSMEKEKVCGSRMLWDILYPNEPVPYWLSVINKHDVGLFDDMTQAEECYHVQLTYSVRHCYRGSLGNVLIVRPVLTNAVGKSGRL